MEFPKRVITIVDFGYELVVYANEECVYQDNNLDYGTCSNLIDAIVDKDTKVESLFVDDDVCDKMREDTDFACSFYGESLMKLKNKLAECGQTFETKPQ